MPHETQKQHDTYRAQHVFNHIRFLIEKLSCSTALLGVLSAAACGATIAPHELPLSQRVANGAMARWSAGHPAPAGAASKSNQGSSQELGTLLEGMDAVWMDTADPRYFHYIQDSVDGLLDEHAVESVLPGRQLLLLYRVTQKPEYLKAATQLYIQLQHDQLQHPARSALAEPFNAEYAMLSHHPEEFSEITRQFVLMEEHARDAKIGLLDHGWYMMALVDTLDYYPQSDPGRAQLLAILRRQAAAVARDQDPATGLWRQVVNKPGATSDELQPSSARMFVYALAKGVRRGYLPEHYLANAERAYHAILTRFIKADRGGEALLASGDAAGAGAFLLASVEMENAQNARLGRGDTVVVDGWFNSQQRADAFGKQNYFHYKWGTEDEPGYSFFGHLFRLFGAQTTELDAEPTFANLKGAQVYVIASPDNLQKNPKAHFANAEDADQIARWVRAGGVLVIMENDTSFADLEHFNAISEKFGIHFNSVLRKHVVGTEWDMGKIVVDGSGPIFHHPHTLYMKDVCTISVSGPAKPALTEDGDIFMATAKYGKGTVYANVDPWLYNEYTDGRKLPAKYDNLAGGKELVRWVLEQVPQP